MSTATTHYSAPYTIPAAQWRLWGTEAPTHLVHVASDGTESAIVGAWRNGPDAMVVTTDDSAQHAYTIDEDVTVRAPRTTFAAIRALRH